MASLSERGYNTGARSRGETFMSDQAIVLQGTVGPDGTLDVPDKVPLSAGRVRVIIQKLSDDRGQTLPEVLRRIHQAREARGARGLSQAELDAELAALRAEDEEEERRWRAIHSHTRHPLPPEGER